MDLGLFDEGRAKLEECLLMCSGSGLRVIEGAVLGVLGGLDAREGNLEQARTLLERGESVLRGTTNQVELVTVLCRRGGLEVLEDRRDQAQKTLEEVRSIATRLGVSSGTSIGRMVGDLEEAIRA